jgi:predicted dehydrogenase
MMRIGIIGCGKVADKHVSQIRRIKGCEIVGVCDKEELMACQLAERYGIPRAFCEIGELLLTCRPDVVHITTPPQSHHPIARECLQAGCHVYVEKPFTLSAAEAEDLIALAQATGMKMTVGNETQFTPVARDMRRMIHSGYLGGDPVHMESVYCYEFNDERYARALLGDRNHWVRRLPGGLLQNIISHGIGKIVEYLPGDTVTVLAHGFTSAFLEGMGENDIKDELRLIIVDDHGTTAYFTFSSQISPPLHQFRVYGPRNSLVADYEHQTLIKVSSNYKSYLNQFIPPFREARQFSANGRRNIRRFLKRELHAESGIHFLITSFYRAVTEDGPPPIPYKDVLLTSRVMEEVFRQLKTGRLCAQAEHLPTEA